jgi:pyruvate,water dikinase
MKYGPTKLKRLSVFKTGGRMAYIVGIEEPQALDPQLVGRKFAALARAAREGFAVPEAVAIVTQAHAYFMHAGNWPAGLRDEAVSAARRLQGPRGVSIRSSAIREDLAGQSFAGQYRSFLEVHSELEMLSCIEKCWNSGGSDTVRSYLRALNVQGSDTETPVLAVIIQRMVGSAIAGVAFSRNPLQPAQDQIVIEAVKGYAEELVSGRRSPCRATVRRDGRLSVEVDSSAHRWLSRATPWRPIAALLERLEKSYGLSALDIEWAVDHGQRLWLLQIRPMTALAQAEGLPPMGSWTRKIADDLWADRLEPFMAEVMLRHAPRFDLSRICRLAGISTVQPALTVINGYLYVNCDSIRNVISYLPRPLRFEDLNSLLPTGSRVSDLPGPRLRTLFRILLRLTRLPLQEPRMIPWICLRDAPRSIRRLRARLKPKEIRSGQTAGGLLGRLQADLETLALIQENNQWPYFHATGLTWVLRWLIVDRLKMNGSLFLTLLSRGALNITIQIERWFREMACHIAADPHLKARFWSEPTAQLCGSLPDRLRVALDEFLQRYGSRSRHRTLLVKRWVEAPDEVVGILQSLVRHPHGMQRPMPNDGEKISIGLGGGFTFALQLLVVLTRRFLDLREELRFLLDEALLRIRLDMLALGKVWGLGEFIFFLTLPEIQDLVSGRLTRQEADLIARQRQQRFSRPYDPGVFWVDGQPEYDFITGNTVLRGIGTSVGRVSGRAVIIESPVSARIRRGDVVVARHTDPGWTPIFSLIGGIVTEEGGLLNHCSIVARELGIPSIVGVSRATQLIPEGSRVTIDGGAGLVWMEKD